MKSEKRGAAEGRRVRGSRGGMILKGEVFESVDRVDEIGR